MKFGICTNLETAAAVKDAGWDYVEPSVQDLLQGTLANDQWRGKQRLDDSPLRAYSANLLVPAALKVTGPDISPAQLSEYMSRVTYRAAHCGINVLVFGSGGARQVPDLFDRDQAKHQVLAFLHESAELASRQGIRIVVEPLNRGECNIINSVAEAMEYVRAVNRSNHLGCLVDSYHLWLEDEPLDHVAEAMQFIHHVHVADKIGRVPPGESGGSDYRPLFHVLKLGGYDGNISVEGDFSEAKIRRDGRRVLEFLKDQWRQA